MTVFVPAGYEPVARPLFNTSEDLEHYPFAVGSRKACPYCDNHWVTRFTCFKCKRKGTVLWMYDGWGREQDGR